MTVAPSPRTTILHLQCHACERCGPATQIDWSLEDLWNAFWANGWQRRIVDGGTLYACPEHPFEEEMP